MLAEFKAAIFTACLNAFFLIPFWCYSREDFYVYHQEESFLESAVYLSQMFELFPHNGGSSRELLATELEMPLTIGIALLVGMALFLYALGQKRVDTKWKQIGIGLSITSVVLIFMISWLFPWEYLSKISIVETLTSAMQYVWRLEGEVSLLLCVIAGLGIVYFTDNHRRRVCVGLILCAISLITTFYMYDINTYERESEFNKLIQNFQSYTDALYLYYIGEDNKYFFDKYEPVDFSIHALNGTDIEYSNYEKKGVKISVDVAVDADESFEQETLVFPMYYYPGYEISINGTPIDVFSVGEMAACVLNEREAHIEMDFVGKWYFKYAYILSIVTLFWGVTLPVFRTVKQKRSKSLG